MTRKDYVKLAGALAAARAVAGPNPYAERAMDYAEQFISNVLADDNGLFDEYRFHMAAIGQPVTGRDRP